MHPYSTRLRPLRRLAILSAGLTLVALTAWVHAQSEGENLTPQTDFVAQPSAAALSRDHRAFAVTSASRQQTSAWKSDAADVWDRWSEGEFVDQALASTRAEIAAARLALEQALNPEVKAFAQELEHEHTHLNRRLLALRTAQESKVQAGAASRGDFLNAASPPAMIATSTRTASPDSGKPSEPRRYFHPPSLQALSHKHGIEFDLAFMDWQINHHRAALRRFEVAAEWTSDTAADAGASALAREALPSLRSQVARAEELARQLASR